MSTRSEALLLRADREVAEKLLPHEHSLPVRLLELVAKLGDQPAMRILCGSVIATGLVRGDRQLRRAGIRMLAAHSLATLAKDFVKHRVDRSRPRASARPGKDSRPRPGCSDAKEENSFPSGHSAGAAAVARAYLREYPGHKLPAGAAAAGLALAQIPRCAHYPTDVGAGIAIGLGAEALVDLAARLALNIPAPDKDGHEHGQFEPRAARARPFLFENAGVAGRSRTFSVRPPAAESL